MNNQLTIHPRENLLYVLSVIVSFLILLGLAFSVVGIIIVAAVALLTLFSHTISMTHIRVNGVQLSKNQFPSLYEKTEELARKMELGQTPEVYIIQSGGILNAFASRIFGMFGKNMVVLYSDIVELVEQGSEDEIEFIIAHELAHIKRNHIVKSLYLFPAMWVPFLGEAYSRACEYTCDRMATYYTGKSDAGINAMMVLAAGKYLYKHMDKNEYIEQLNNKRGFLVVLTEMLSTHPPLPKRIHAIELFAKGESLVSLKATSKGMIAAVLVGMFLGFGSLVWSFYYVINDVVALIEGDWGFSETWLDSESTPLMDAAMNGDIEMMEMLLAEGVDPNEQEEGFGETALFFAIDSMNTDVVQVLLDAGADVNLQDFYGWSVLIEAVMNEDIEMVQFLLENGADPHLANDEGETAITYSKMYGNKEIQDLLQSYME